MSFEGHSLAKRLFEASRIPLSFDHNRDNWIRCREGNVCVRWLGRRWVILARGMRAIYPDERELYDVVREVCLQLGGVV